jgi:hypothetical protein
MFMGLILLPNRIGFSFVGKSWSTIRTGEQSDMKTGWYGKTLVLIGVGLVGAGTGAAQTGSDQQAAAPSSMGQTIAPANNDPERDSRGTRVISDPAVVPRGANEPLGSQSGASRDPKVVFATQSSTEEYRRCTKEVTDNCVQFWEPPKYIPVCPGDPECPEGG